VPDFPTTRISLLLRVKDKANHGAWEEFVSIYQPVVYRFGRQRGLQSADAQDLAQNVMSAVVERIPDWEPDSSRAHFRTWLSRIAANQTVTMFRRRKPDAARGGTSAMMALHSQPQDDFTDLQMNYRREVFRFAAKQVRAEFEEATWQAFWLTAVDGISVADAARSLGRSIGSVYTARSRIVRRLQELTSDFDEELPNSAVDREAQQ